MIGLKIGWFCSLSVQSGFDFFFFGFCGGGVSDEAIGGVCWNLCNLF